MFGRTRHFRYADIERVEPDPTDAGASIVLVVNGVRHSIPGPSGGRDRDPARDREAAVEAIRHRCPQLTS